jgi:arginyl-tRNA synthetase
VEEYLLNLFEQLKEKLEYLSGAENKITIPKQNSHGDYSWNVAMILAKKLKKNPRELAQEIIDNIDVDNEVIQKVEIAGPGFINFFFNPDYVVNVIKNIIEQKEGFGKSDKNKGKRAVVEFVSANPTGPLTVGHGRNAVVGDTVANLLEWIGYDVDREYYFNNAGRQMRVLGDSVKKRYLQLLGEDIEFPEDYYQGEYIRDISQKIVNEFGDRFKENNELDFFKERAEKEIFDDIEKTLNNINIKFNKYYNENSLYEDGKIDALLKELKEKKLSYEKDGATWLRLTELGIEQDKVIVKSTGEPTYRLPDVAYHETKYQRGYDLIVDIFGADHIATYPDVVAALKALGYDEEKLHVVIYQFVTILQGGEKVKMSTRKANFITLDELIDEVGADVVRYFFIMKSTTSHLNFDLEVAKKHSDENPVFYLQYAHARIASLLKTTGAEGLKCSTENLNLLNTDAEQFLLKKLHEFEKEVIYSAENYEPHRIANYLTELAALFHKFYTECRILGTEKNLAEARIALIIAVKTVLKNGLSILGVSAPERM